MGKWDASCSCCRSKDAREGAAEVVETPDEESAAPSLDFLEAVDSWFNVLLPKIYPFLYHNGGNIISIQVHRGGGRAREGGARGP